MSEAIHTPEPLHYDQVTGEIVYKGEVVARLAPLEEYPCRSTDSQVIEAKINATGERLVAAYNECGRAGISTEALENGAVVGLLTAYQATLAFWYDDKRPGFIPVNEYQELRENNEKMLRAAIALATGKAVQP